jgi:hypothetical protein
VGGELLVPADERVQVLVVVVSGSKRMPSGARSISMPLSPTYATPATSTSRSDGGCATAAAPFVVHASGSNPRRSVNRQCSSLVVGSGSAS